MKLVIILLLPMVIISKHLDLLSNNEAHIVYCAREIALRYYKRNSLGIIIYPSQTKTEVSMKRSLANSEIDYNANHVTGSIINYLNMEMKWDIKILSLSISHFDIQEWPIINFQNIGQYILIFSTDGMKNPSHGLHQQHLHFINRISIKPRNTFQIIIVLGSNLSDTTLEYTSTFAFYSKTLNTIILHSQNKHRNNEHLILYTWVPDMSQCWQYGGKLEVNKWIKIGEGKFESDKDLFPTKITRNMPGCKVRIEDTGDGKSDLTISSLTNVIYYDIIKRFGYKLAHHSKRHSDHSVMFVAMPLVDIYFSRLHITSDSFYPYLQANLRLYVPCNRPKPKMGNILAVFSLSLWFLIFVTILLTSLITYGLHRKTEFLHYREIMLCFYCIWCVLTSVSVPQQPRTGRVRALFIIWVSFCFVISLIFQAFFTSFLIEPGMQKSISTSKELEKSNLKIIQCEGELTIRNAPNSYNELFRKKMIFSKQKTIEMLINMSLSNNYSFAIFAKDVDAKAFPENHRLCSIQDYNIISLFTAYMFRRDILFSPIKFAFEQYYESGIMAVLVNKFLEPYRRSIMRQLQHSDEEEMYFKLTTSHLTISFYILLGGCALSFLFVVTEIIFSKF
ncbi:Ionotropic receptor 698 [Blattella germanica]|nr:Ionotropic receptor 698 [Blattella germanica]